MANKLLYSTGNVLQMFSVVPEQDVRYNSKDFDDYDFPSTILPWEQNTGYCQPWQLNDSIAIQLQSNVGPVNFILKECDGDSIVDTIQLDQKLQSINDPTMFIYEMLAPLLGYTKRCYYGVLEFGLDPVVFRLRTGELNFKNLHENTLLLEGKHFEFREDIIYETGFFPSLRVRATKKYLGPKHKATVYEDQVLNLSALRSQKFRKWLLRIGGATGIPDYLADIIGSMMGSSDLRIDGKYYTVFEGSELEPNEVDKFPMRGWSVELRERYTKASKTYENEIPMNALIAIAVNSDTKGFGNSNTGSQTIMIDVT